MNPTLNKLRSGVLVAAAMIPAFAWAAPQRGDVAVDVAAIQALNNRIVAAFNSNDPVAMAATFAEDAVLMLPNQPAIEGRKTIQALFEVRFRNYSVKIVNTTLEVEVAGDWAYIRGKFTRAITPKSGGKTVEGSSKYLRLLRRQSDGSWKIYRSIDNHDEPPS